MSPERSRHQESHVSSIEPKEDASDQFKNDELPRNAGPNDVKDSAALRRDLQSDLYAKTPVQNEISEITKQIPVQLDRNTADFPVQDAIDSYEEVTPVSEVVDTTKMPTIADESTRVVSPDQMERGAKKIDREMLRYEALRADRDLRAERAQYAGAGQQESPRVPGVEKQPITLKKINEHIDLDEARKRRARADQIARRFVEQEKADAAFIELPKDRAARLDKMKADLLAEEKRMQTGGSDMQSEAEFDPAYREHLHDKVQEQLRLEEQTAAKARLEKFMKNETIPAYSRPRESVPVDPQAEIKRRLQLREQVRLSEQQQAKEEMEQFVKNGSVPEYSQPRESAPIDGPAEREHRLRLLEKMKARYEAEQKGLEPDLPMYDESNLAVQEALKLSAEGAEHERTHGYVPSESESAIADSLQIAKEHADHEKKHGVDQYLDRRSESQVELDDALEITRRDAQAEMRNELFKTVPVADMKKPEQIDRTMQSAQSGKSRIKGTKKRPWWKRLFSGKK